jgi:type II secretory pathway pseudopilin PulG
MELTAMGGIILVGLIAVLIVILITPALRARAKEKREEVDRTAHEAVVSRLEDHRRRKQTADTDRSDGSDG